MKWLNVLTDTEKFSEIVYELYDSEKDRDKYSVYSSNISELHKEKSALFDENLDKLQKYIKKTKKNQEEVYSTEINEDDVMVFTAVDPKASEYVEGLNSAWIYMNRLGSFLEAPYVFTEADVERMPELKDMKWPKERMVYSISFPGVTSWEKLGVTEQIKHIFVAAMASGQLMEQIS